MSFMISRKRDYTRLVAALGAGLTATLLMLPQAKGELVYEDEDTSLSSDGAASQPVETREDSRGTLRQALGSSRKAQVTLESQGAPVVIRQNTNVTTTSHSSSEVENVSKTELMRRERVREELKNEDVLQERLEELRLRDERRRTDQLLGLKVEEDSMPAPAASMKTEVISGVAPETVGQPVMASAVMTDQMVMSKAAPVSVAGEAATHDGIMEKVTFTVAPRGGLATMANTTGYDVRPRYSAGLGLGMGVSDHLSVETSYSFSEYGVALSSDSQFAVGYNSWAPNYSNGFSNFEARSMRQHLFDIGMKLHFLGPESRIRPFIGGGGGYSLGFLNYDSRVLSSMHPSLAQVYGRDYQVNSFLGYLSTGLDVKITKSISVGVIAKYYAVLSARENNMLNPAAMYGYSYGYNMYSPANYYAAMADQDKMQVAGTLARTGFFVIQGGVSFNF